MTDLLNKNSIEMYFHCKLCLDDGLSQDIEAGWTERGLQIWCVNHDCNMVNIDFEGHVHPADITRKIKPPKLQLVEGN